MQRTVRGKTIHVRYDSYDDLIRHAQQPHPGGRVADASISSDPHWTGTKTYAEALGLVQNGWPAGRSRMTRALTLAKRVSRSAAVKVESFDVAGGFPEIALAVAGDPACMIDPGDTMLNAKPVMRLIIPQAVSACVSNAAIENFGGAVLAAVDRLEAEGNSVELTGRSLMDDAPWRAILDVPLKAAGEPLDIDRLGFALVHPSFLRRIMFRAYELDPTLGPHTSHYGIPADPTEDELEGAIWIPGPTYHDHQTYDTPEGAVAAVEAVVDKALDGILEAHYDRR